MRYTLLFAAAVLFLGGSLACAESITIQNPSFEVPNTGHQNGALPDGWSVEGTDYGTEVGPYDGLQCMFVGSGSGGHSTLYQLTDHTITSGDEYTLTFYAKFTWSSAVWPGSYEGGLYYDDNGTRTMLGTAGGTFEDSATGYQWNEYILVVPIGPGSPAIGKKLGFSYTNTTVLTAEWGIWAGCDLVSLENANTKIAKGPTPGDGDELVDPATNFNWGPPPDYTPDKYAMYLRTGEPNFAAPGNILEGEEVTPVYDHPDDLAYDTTYHWRIDSYEPNLLGTGFIVNTGAIWSFTTAPETPTITLQPISQTVAAGSEVVLAIDGTNIDEVQWFRNGDPIAAEDDDVFDLTLTISNVQAGSEGGEGYYHCVAKNTAGDDISETARVLTRRLAGWWKLDGNLNDSVADEVPGAPPHAGTGIDAGTGLPTEPNYVPFGADASAIDFLGDGRIVTINDSAEYFNFYRQGQTVSGWVNTNTAGWDGVISKQRRSGTWAGWLIDVNGGWAHVTIRGSHTDLWGTDDDGDMFDDDWHLVTGVMDPDTDTTRFYVDGKLRDTSGVYDLGAALLTDQPVVFGDETVTGDVPYTGMLDDVRIWTYALDDIAVALLYTDFNPGSEVCLGNPSLDSTGPEGVPDCRINVYELAVWAAAWLECNLVPTCIP